MKKAFILIAALLSVKAVSAYQTLYMQENVIILGISAASSITAVSYSTSMLKSTLAEMESEENTKQTILYMQSNHPMLVRDLSIARGPLIEQWGSELHLSSDELQALEERLSGSPEQLKLLQALNGKINVNDALTFKATLRQLFTDIIGTKRLKKVILKSQ